MSLMLNNDEFQRLSLQLEGERANLRAIRAERDDAERKLKHAEANIRALEMKMYGASCF